MDGFFGSMEQFNAKFSRSPQSVDFSDLDVIYKI